MSVTCLFTEIVPILNLERMNSNAVKVCHVCNKFEFICVRHYVVVACTKSIILSLSMAAGTSKCHQYSGRPFKENESSQKRRH
jgi:hypothetical protein